MSAVRTWFVRFGGLFGRERRDRELEAEMASHLAMHIEDNLRAGMTPEEARRQAVMKLGGVEQTKESYRERRGILWLDTLLQDVRFGLRMLRRSPGFAVLTILCLTLGIGANAAVFSWIEGILLRPYPLVSNQERLVALSGTLGEERRKCRGPISSTCKEAAPCVRPSLSARLPARLWALVSAPRP